MTPELLVAKQWLKRNQSWPAATINVNLVEELVGRVQRLERELNGFIEAASQLDVDGCSCDRYVPPARCVNCRLVAEIIELRKEARL